VTDDLDAMARLCAKLLDVLDENAELRDVVLVMATGDPLDAHQQALLDAVAAGRWSR
jgi:hypothetical protein